MSEGDEGNGKSSMMFWGIIAGAIGFALCVLGASCFISRRNKAGSELEEEEESCDDDVEQCYEGSGRRGSGDGRGSSNGRQRHQSARAMFYEGGDDNVVPPDYLFVERGHDERRMIRDRQAEIDLMNKLYGNQRPSEWM